MANSTELIKNGSFDSGTIDSATKWFIPTDWEVGWNNSFYGSLNLESVGAVYSAANALLLNYTPSEDEWNYDTVYKKVLPPGICQTIDLRKQNVSNINHFKFSMNARLNFDESPCNVDVIFYKGISDSYSSQYSFDDVVFEEYEVLASFPIEASPVWNYITFDIDATAFTAGVYKMYITPHIDETGVVNENIVEKANIIIDDISLLMVEASEDGTDLIDTGAIKNGSFSRWRNDKPEDWTLINIDELLENDNGVVITDATFDLIQTDDYERSSSLIMDWGKDGYGHIVSESKITPGLYQVLDLSQYEYGAEITLNYSVRKDTINHSYTPNTYYGIHLFIYHADDYVDGSEEYDSRGLDDYSYHRMVRLESAWTKHTDTISLNQGRYLIGFTPDFFTPVEGGSSIEGIQSVTEFHAVIDDVSATIKSTVPVVSYENIVYNDSFENWSIGSDGHLIDDWTYEREAVYAAVIRDSDLEADKYPIYDLGDYYCSIRYEKGVLQEDKEIFHYGLKQRVLSKASSKAIFSFWHRTGSSSQLTFKAAVYETFHTISDDTYRIVEPAIFEDVITTCDAGWDNYTTLIDVKYNTYYTIIFYPTDDTSASSIISLDKVSFTPFTEGTFSHYGTFNDPYPSDYGFLGCNLNTNKDDGSYVPTFYPYNSNLPNGEYFIECPVFGEDPYYICTNGQKDEQGFFLCYSDEMVASPCDLQGTRYFFKDGHMAINTIFEYNGKSYIADAKGALKEYVLDIRYIGGTSNTVTITTNKSKIITLTFNEQAFPCILNTEISNTSIATITNVTEGTTSNEITILGKKMGKTTFRAWALNPNGTYYETIINIQVKDQIPEEYKYAQIHIPYDENSMDYNSSIQVSYYVLPEYLSDLDIDWSSSDETIAVVDADGQILSRDKFGQCTITAANAFSGESTSFTLYVRTLEVEDKVSVSESNITLALGQSKQITAKVLNNTGISRGVIQDVRWISEDTNVATVDKFGKITAVNRGSTKIKCACAFNMRVYTYIQVTVTGSVVELQDIELDCYEINILESDYDTESSDKYIKINYRPIPSNATNTDVIWSSSNEDKATVSEGGFVHISHLGLEHTFYITCTSKSRPSVSKTCKVNFVSSGDKLMITSFDTGFNVCKGKTLRIDYNCLNVYNDQGTSWAGTHEVSITTETTNTVSTVKSENGYYINFVANEVGTFSVKLTIPYGDYLTGSVSKVFTVQVHESDVAPVLKKDLTVLYALQNDSCILRCKIEDEIDDLRDIVFYIDFGDGNGFEQISSYFDLESTDIYQYFFISGYGLTPGTAYQTRVKAVDSQGNETITNSATLTIPLIQYDHKTHLANAKSDYDSVMTELNRYMNWIIASDNRVIEEYRANFFVYYRMFCYTYENLRDMLSQCVEIINSQIETSQTEIATLSNTLSSDGVSMATYSAGDCTNSNYQNVTDMDYYQNECIRQLVARVLELEAKLNELTGNNK